MPSPRWSIRWETSAQILAVLLVPAVLFVILLLPGGDLDVIAHREDASPDFWTIQGRVRQPDGAEAGGATVWAIVKNARGDRESPPTVVAAPDGRFAIPNLPKKLDGSDARTIEIYARLPKGERKGLTLLRSGEAADMANTGPPKVIGGLAAVLLLGMLLPFLSSTPGRTRYVVSMVLAVLFNFGVIGGLGYSMYKVNALAAEGRIPSLGFISVFRGSYVDGAPQQWVISLSDRAPDAAAVPAQTAPPAAAAAVTASSADPQPPAASAPPTKGGFGAPMWVLLLAAIGSGILTVSLVTREIREPPDNDPKVLREKMYSAVQLQVYILFSPISAIFVYQTMVMTNTAGQPLVVALATLGAGAALNVLLKYAVDSATALFNREPGAPAHKARAAAS